MNRRMAQGTVANNVQVIPATKRRVSAGGQLKKAKDIFSLTEISGFMILWTGVLPLPAQETNFREQMQIIQILCHKNIIQAIQLNLLRQWCSES